MLLSLPSFISHERKVLFLAGRGHGHFSFRIARHDLRLLTLVVLLLLAIANQSIFSNRRAVESWASTDDLAASWRATTVVATQSGDNATWIADAFPQWDHKIYVTDDQKATLAVPKNKGRESMVYLTYIIDHYERLPQINIFQHAGRYQWHVDDPLYDGVRSLSRLRLPYVMEQGYVNLRCVWTLGCPSEIQPLSGDDARPAGMGAEAEDRVGSHYKAAFEQLFPDMPVPENVAASCCAQFAVTSSKIRERPKSDYEHFRQWLLDTDLPDYLSGRIMEYSWHIIFGMPAVHCPNAKECYCSIFGLCDLSCEEEGACQSQYTLPRVANMPPGWPDYDWHGQWRDVSKL